MQITLDRSGRDGIGLGCSSRCSGRTKNEHLPFRFLFRSEAHKPRHRLCPVEHPKRASSPPWANPHWRVFFCPLNHAVRTHNACVSHRRIKHKRADNQRHLDSQTGVLKEAQGSFCHVASTLNHAGVTARGFRLVKVEPRDSENAEACPIQTTVSAGEILGVSLCNRAEPSKQSVPSA